MPAAELNKTRTLTTADVRALLQRPAKAPGNMEEFLRAAWGLFTEEEAARFEEAIERMNGQISH